MACILYREGKGTIAHGVECESTTCEIEHLDSMIKSGWLQNPPGYEPPEPVAVEEEIAEEDDDSETVESQLRADVKRLEGDVEQEETADGNLDPVRIQAREAGIEGWDTKRITTLKKALEA
jgi:hypothetical protein